MTRNQIAELATDDEVELNGKPGIVTGFVPAGNSGSTLARILWGDGQTAYYDKESSTIQEMALTRKKSVLVSGLPPVHNGKDLADAGSHPADSWITSLFTGGIHPDTRLKLRRGFDEGYIRGLADGRAQGFDAGFKRGLQEGLPGVPASSADVDEQMRANEMESLADQQEQARLDEQAQENGR